MKLNFLLVNFNVVLAIVLSGFFSNADDKSEKVTDVLICLRELVSEKGGNANSLKYAAEALNSLEKNQTDVELDAIKNKCTELQEQLKFVEFNSSIKINDHNILDDLQIRSSLSDKNVMLLYSFLVPQVKCEIKTLDFAAGIFVGLDLKAGYSVCTSYDGRRWLRAHTGAGVGMMAGVQGSSDTGTKKTNGLINSTEYQSSFSGALVVSQESGHCSGDSLAGVNDLMDCNQRKGNGVGIATGVVMSAKELTFTIFPLPTDKKIVLRSFFDEKYYGSF